MKQKQRSRRKSASEQRASESRLPFIPAQVLRGLLALLLRPFKAARTRVRHCRSFASKPTDSGTLEPACWIRTACLEGHQTRKGRVSAVPHSGLNQAVSGWRRPSLARPSQTVLISCPLSQARRQLSKRIPALRAWERLCRTYSVHQSQSGSIVGESRRGCDEGLRAGNAESPLPRQ